MKKSPNKSTPSNSNLEPDESRFKLPWHWATDLKPNLEANDFVEGILSNNGLSVVYGPSGSGKSFVALDMAVAIASGQNWYDRECDKGAVIYLAAEGAIGVQNRLAALIKEGRLPKGARLVYVPCCISILEKKQVVALLGTVREAMNGIDEPVRLIILDTLSRCMSGANENAPEDMTKVVSAADVIRDITGAHVMFVHHCGKNAAADSRGHSSLRAAADTEIEIQREEGEIGQILCRKAKDMGSFEPMAFQLKPIELGTNHRGKPVTSCILERLKPEDIPQPKTAVDGAKGIILEALAESKDGLNTTEIWALPGAGKKPKADALKSLTKGKVVVMSPDGKSKRYRLNQHEQSAQIDPKDYPPDTDAGRGKV